MTTSSNNSRRFLAAAFATVLVFGVLGPPIGGLIAGKFAVSVTLMAKIMTMRASSNPSPFWP
jgi:hypothetical protein